MSILSFWILDLIFEGTGGALQFQFITKIIKLIIFLIGFILLHESLSDLFINYFMIYFSIHVILDIITIYLEKSDNDIKLCLQWIIMFIYPILFCGRRFKVVCVVAMLFCIGTLSA